jgi:hypothetical protein
MTHPLKPAGSSSVHGFLQRKSRGELLKIIASPTPYPQRQEAFPRMPQLET